MYIQILLMTLFYTIKSFMRPIKTSFAPSAGFSAANSVPQIAMILF